MPDIPTVAEFVPGYEAVGFDGIDAPNGTPVTVIETLNREINAVLQHHEAGRPSPNARAGRQD